MKFWFGKEKESEEASSKASTVAECPTPAAGNPPAVGEKPTVTASSAPVPPPAPASVQVPAQKPSFNPVQPPVSAAAVQPQVSQRDMYCNLMNALYDAVLVIDSEGHVVDCNSRVEAIFGYSEDDMWDRPAKDIIKGFGPQLLAQIAVPLREHRPVIVDGMCIRRDGTTFAAEIAFGSVRLARGENVVLSIRDVNKRMAAMMERLRNQGVVPQKPSVVRLVSPRSALHPRNPA